MPADLPLPGMDEGWWRRLVLRIGRRGGMA
jgi:hypothetical protein